MESFMAIHEGFKTMQEDQEEFTVDEIEQISSEDEFADVQTIKAKDTKATEKAMPKESKKKEEAPTATTTTKTTKAMVNSKKEEVVEGEEETREFITKYIESEEDMEESKTPETTARATKTKTSVKEGFQGSTLTQMSNTKLILLTLIIVMISFILNMDNTRMMVKSWLRCGTKTVLCISALFGLLVYVVLKIFV
jgi:cobalamin biosynthesis Mg chelatase CobN